MIAVKWRARLALGLCVALLGGAAGCSGGASPGQAAASPSDAPAPAETPAPGDHDLTLRWDGLVRTNK